MMNLPNGTLLQGGKYRIEGVLGQGGFGITYRATNLAFDEPVAIKEFFMKGVNDRGGDHTTVSVSNRDNVALFDEQIAKFRKEARRIRKLRNVHIVAVHDLFDENGTAYYVMDYVEGESLGQRLERVGHALTETEVCGILNQLLEALAVVHAQGFWHLDVKPGNVLVDNDGLVRLIDFGASKQMKLDGGATTNTQAAYTKGYAPLEQVSQRLDDVGAWTDLYATGALCYKLLTDEALPEAYDLLLNGESVFKFPKGMSDNMQSLIKWMMKPNHKDRPQSVAEVQARLTPANLKTIKIVEPEPIDADVTIVVPDRQQRKIEPPAPPLQAIPQPELQSEDEVYGDAPVVHPNLLKQKAYEDEQEALKVKRQGAVRQIMSNMVAVEGGTFTMGCLSGRDGSGYGDEFPAHEVTLSAFRICRFVVTQKEWEAIMNENPSNFKGDRLPVTNVSWNDCQVFIERLNKISGERYRLPTEAEWEFAARGGVQSKSTLYSGGDILSYVAWSAENADHTPHPVGQKFPNELGLYDMTGNVHEWCQDGMYAYQSKHEKNPCHDGSGRRVTRGGCWLNGAGFLRIAQRGFDSADMQTSTIGFRLVLDEK